MEWGVNIVERRRRNRFKEWAILSFVFFSCFCALYNPHILSESMRLLSIQADGISYNVKYLKRHGIRTRNGETRRLLGGPGSSPPLCWSKCNGCTPCDPVHVPVPSQTRVTTEYYPEAWRCKCRNKFYMP